MSKKVTIPTDGGNPFVIIHNGVKYIYSPGETVTVSDGVALEIEEWKRWREKYRNDDDDLLGDVVKTVNGVKPDKNGNVDLDDSFIEAEKTEIFSHLNKLAENDKALSARMDTFTALPEGSTTGDAELIDGRVDKDGVTHPNIGEHIRNVTGQLSEEIAVQNKVDWIHCYFADGNYPKIIVEDDTLTATLDFIGVTKLIAKGANGINVGEFTVDDIFSAANSVQSLTVDTVNKKISGKAFTFVYDTEANAICFYAGYKRNKQDIVIFHNYYASTMLGVIVDYLNMIVYNRAIHDVVIMPDAECDFYFESTGAQGSGLLFSFDDWIYIRGRVKADKSWAAFKNLFLSNVVTSSKGIECIEIPHNYALFVNDAGVFTIERFDTNLTYTKTPIFIVSSGNVCGGIGEFLYTRYLADKNNDTTADVEDYFIAEVEECVSKLESECTQKSLVFAVLSDSHYTGLNNWKNTVKNIGAVNDRYKFDAIYHLGDIVQGDKEKSITASLIGEVRNDLYKANHESYLITGNHDDNSFTTNHEYQYTKAEQYALMCRYKDVDVKRESNNLYWYKDYDSFGIRVICLDSHLGEGTNGYGSSWGYPIDVVNWVRDIALDTEYQVLFMSHIPLTADFNAYQSETVNAENLRTVIKDYIENGGTVIGFIHGHTHWDFIGMKDANTFNEISIGASNTTMSYGNYKPNGAVVQERVAGTVTEDLWDILVVQPEEKKVKLIRFGAGVDREFAY